MGIPERAVLSQKDRTRQVARVLWVTLGLNVLAAILKIAFGWTSQTMVIMADGIHSLSDGTSNVIGLIGIYLSGNPPDEKYPYGHHKFETMASIGIAAMLIVLSIGILQQSYDSFFHPHTPQITAASFWIMFLTLLINLGVVMYERSAAKRLKSELLWSDSWHTLTDVFVTLGVFVALIGMHFRLYILDAVFSVIVGAAIIHAAIEILKHSADILTDKAMLDSAEVEKMVLAIPGVEDCHEVRTRGKKFLIYVDLHVLVDPHMSVETSHQLANRIERDIKKGFEGVVDVVVHIEPTTHGHEEIIKD